MIVLTTAAHIATLAVHGVVTAIVVDERPTKACPTCNGQHFGVGGNTASVWRNGRIVSGIGGQMMTNVECPDCAEDGRVPLPVKGQRIAVRAAPGWPVPRFGNGGLCLLNTNYEWWVHHPALTPSRGEVQAVVGVASTAEGNVSRNLHTLALHPGCVVGSAVVVDIVPIEDLDAPIEECQTLDYERVVYVRPTDPGNEDFGILAHRIGIPLDDDRDLSDQLAFQQFTHGKWAVLLSDAAPLDPSPVDIDGTWGAMP